MYITTLRSTDPRKTAGAEIVPRAQISRPDSSSVPTAGRVLVTVGPVGVNLGGWVLRDRRSRTSGYSRDVGSVFTPRHLSGLGRFLVKTIVSLPTPLQRIFDVQD